MKLVKSLSASVLLVGFVFVSSLAVGAEKDSKVDKDAKLKPYTLETCVVSGEKLGEMGKPYVHEYKGREIKFCCKSCLKDFNKDSAKYVKKLEEAEAKAKK